MNLRSNMVGIGGSLILISGAIGILWAGYWFLSMAQSFSFSDISVRFANPIEYTQLYAGEIGNCQYVNRDGFWQTICRKPEIELTLEQFNDIAGGYVTVCNPPGHDNLLSNGVTVTYEIELPDRIVYTRVPFILPDEYQHQTVKGFLWTLSYNPGRVELQQDGSLLFVLIPGPNTAITVYFVITILAFFFVGAGLIVIAGRK